MSESNLFVRNIPSIQEREFKYRMKMSSEQLNNLQDEAFNDILDLFNKANQLQKTIYEFGLCNNIESVCYSKRLNEAIAELNHMTELYNNIMSTEKDFRYQTKYAYEASTEDDAYSATIDKNTNSITSHVASSISKTKIYDETYDETYVPSSLQAFVGPDDFIVGGNIYSIEDTDITNAFDGNSSTVWLRKVITNQSVQEIENEVVVGLPEDIITTRLINQIVIKAFPVGYIDIVDIKYKANGSWQTIPGFETHNQYTSKKVGSKTYKGILDSSNIKFNFQNIQTNQLKIKLRQRNYETDSENNRRIWYLGLRDVDVSYNVYTRDHSEFDMVYDFQETERNIKVYDTEVSFNNNNITEDEQFGVTKDYYYYDSDGNTHKVASTCPFILRGHKLKVRFTIEGVQETPNIYSAKVKYKLA